MKLGGKESWVVVSTLEDVAKVVTHNADAVERILAKQTKSIKRIKFLGFLNAAGLLYLLADNKKKADDVDRLKENFKKLEDDYHNYVISHSEYDPDKDKDMDDFWG